MLKLEKFLYKTGVILFLVMVVRSVYFTPYSAEFEILILLVLLAYSSGSLIWLYRTSGKVNLKPIWYLLFIPSNFISAPLSFVAARYRITEVTGLPAGDYSSSIALLSGIYYLPILLCLISFILHILSLVYLIAVGLLSWPSALENFIDNVRERLNLPNGNNAAGMAMISLLLLALGASSFGLISDKKDFWIKKAIYVLDYSQLENYPNVKGDKKILIHATGFISTAKITDSGEIKFQTIIPDMKRQKYFKNFAGGVSYL